MLLNFVRSIHSLTMSCALTLVFALYCRVTVQSCTVTRPTDTTLGTPVWLLGRGPAQQHIQKTLAITILVLCDLTGKYQKL